MSTQVQYRRGTGAQNDAFTGALAEITVDTTNGTLRVHDGIVAGGSNIATVSYVDNAISSLSANSISDGTSSLAVIATNGNIRANIGGSTVGLFSSTGLVITGSIEATNGFIGLDASKISNGTSNVSVITSGGNVDVNVGGNPIVTFHAGGMDNRQANGVGNIGTATSYFNTVFAQATSAQYADVAERYLADADYAVGTILVFGGDQEVTQSQIDHTPRVAGTVSDRPAYVMNTGLTGDHVVSVALLGRVPVRVIGTIRPGDLLVASELPGVATGLVRDRYAPGCVIGKALESYDSQREGVIEAVVGRL